MLFQTISVTMSYPTIDFAHVCSPGHMYWALLDGVTEALKLQPQLPISHYPPGARQPLHLGPTQGPLKQWCAHVCLLGQGGTRVTQRFQGLPVVVSVQVLVYVSLYDIEGQNTDPEIDERPSEISMGWLVTL